jgi:phosphohistidine phosphatase
MTSRTNSSPNPEERMEEQPTGVDLLIVRHAPAFDRDAERWPDDCDRPLTDKGERSFRRAARGLARVTPRPSVVLASPCVRAWRTAELLAKKAGWPDPEPLDELRPESDAAKALAALASRAPTESVAIVGHDPLLGDLCGMLVGSARVELKKGAVARLAVQSWRSGGATLRALLAPKVLRAARK